MDNKILTIKDLNVSGTSVGFAEDSTYCPSAIYFNNMVVDDEYNVVDVKFEDISGSDKCRITFYMDSEEVLLPFDTSIRYTDSNKVVDDKYSTIKRGESSILVPKTTGYLTLVKNEIYIKTDNGRVLMGHNKPNTITLKNTHNIGYKLDDYFIFYYDTTNLVHEEFQWHFDAWEDFEEHPSAEIMLMTTLAVGSENTLKMGGSDFYYLGNHKYAVKMDAIDRYLYIAIPIFFGSGDTYKIYAVYETSTIGNTMQSVFQARNYIISERVIFENNVAPLGYTETYLDFKGTYYDCSSNLDGDHMYAIVGFDCVYESLNNGYDWDDKGNFGYYKRRTSYNGIYVNSNSFPLENETDYGSTNAIEIFGNRYIADYVNFNEDLEIIIMYA